MDATQSVVQAATVSLTHLATGAAIQVHTDDRGEYRTPPLRIGEYTIAIEANGFKRFNQRGVVLDIGDVRTVDAVLQVGQVSDSVDVEASAPLLQTADATVGTVIGSRQIEDLPLNGRDYMQLATLSGGTIPSINSGIGISVGGQQGYAMGFLLDGVDNNNQSIRYSYGNQKETIKPSIDAIQEFKVVTNTFSAEYGRSSSGVISVSIRSGTNQIHGTAYDFLRNQELDAKNLFATSKPPYKRNDFGGSVGGPIVRNKLFIFGDLEYNKIRQSTTTVDSVPTAGQRGGLFTRSDLRSRHVQCRDGHAHGLCGQSNSLVANQPDRPADSGLVSAAADIDRYQQLRLSEPRKPESLSLGRSRRSDSERQTEPFLPLQRTMAGNRPRFSSAAHLRDWIFHRWQQEHG